MKKFMLSLLILAGAFTAVLSFHACSADEEADEPQHSPQAQLLLQKSSEFAKKYNVNMTLNEDNIEETVKTLSVEEMEKDYREMSEFDICISSPSTPPRGRTVNKLRIRRKTTMFEETTITGSFTCSAEYGTTVQVGYQIGNGGYNDDVSVILTHYSASGTAHLKPQGVTFQGSDKCAFSASGTVMIYGQYRTCYHVFIDHSASGINTCHVSIDRNA